MKARDNSELERLIKRYESHRHMSALSMNILAVVGLISFGLMAGPIFTYHPTSQMAIQEQAEVPAVKTFAHVPIRAHSAVVYDLSTNTVLYGQRESAVLPLASLTKLFTVYTALANTPPKTDVVISEEALAPEGDSGLSVGEHLSLGALERLALVASSNDAAEAISRATAAASNRPSTTLMANAFSALGITDVRTSNASGLDVSLTQSGGYGSALSVAKVAKGITEMDPSLAYTTTRSYITVKSDTSVHTLENTNQTITAIPSPLLSKTGFTDLAGGNLVVVFDAGINHPVAVVVLGSTKEERFSDVEALVEETLRYFAPETTATTAP
jgi:serine-type D-Ala-D-Ala carboxypeptidase (penicillin-binding protein 5/6)